MALSSRLRRMSTLSLVISLSSAGCYRTIHQPLKTNSSLDDVTGVTTRSGYEIPFAVPGATIVNDTLFATGTVGAVKIPTDSIARVSRHGFSQWGSLVVLAAAAAVAFGLVVFALGHTNLGGS
jgi:hypothetical protein